MKTPSFKFSFLLVITLLAATVARAQLIDTASVWKANDRIGGTGPFGEFGLGPFEAYGQTFVVPLGYNALTSFSWSLQSATVFGTDDVTFAAHVAKWDPVNLTVAGNDLYTSSPRMLPPADQQWTTFQFSTDNLTLSAGQPYVVFLSARPFFNGLNGAANVASNTYDLGGDVYFGGKAYLGADFTQLATAPWIQPGVTDFAITAQFSAVPEPSSFGIMATLVLAAIVGIRRRSRAC